MFRSVTGVQANKFNLFIVYQWLDYGSLNLRFSLGCRLNEQIKSIDSVTNESFDIIFYAVASLVHEFYAISIINPIDFTYISHVNSFEP